MTVELLFWKTLIWVKTLICNYKTYFDKANNEKKNKQTIWANLFIKRQLHQLASHDLDFFSLQNT